MKTVNKNLPNILTIIRIALTPVVILLFLLPIKNGIGVFCALAVYIIASCTDFIDGAIARKYNLVSDTGKLLDASADKILQTSALVIVLFNNVVQCELWIKVVLLLIFLIRDCWMSSVRQLCASKGTIIPADVWGKIKSILVDISIGILFFFIGLVETTINGVQTEIFGVSIGYLCVFGLVLLAISSLFCIISGVNYTVNAWPTITGKTSKSAEIKKDNKNLKADESITETKN